MENYIFIWPLIASCSIAVKNLEDDFKPEYIISQLLLEWMRKNRSIIGLRYFSVSNQLYDSEDSHSNNIKLLQNYVFPAESFKKKGLCTQLVKLFRVTDPINWSLNNSLNFIGNIKNERSYKIFDFEYYLELKPGLKYFYKDTEFGIIESSLDGMELSCIKKNLRSRT